MTCVESLPGQQATNLADALHRVIMADGRNALEVLHREGMMKKVQTSQVIMTPTANSKIRLDELNTLLAEMAKGEDAVKRLAEVDQQSGLQKKKRDNTGRDVGQPASKADTLPAVPPLVAGDDGVLSDAAIAAQQVAQATRMKAEATSLLAEAARLEADAAKLMPLSVVKAKAKKVASTAATKAAVTAALKAPVNVNTKKTAKA
jgi:hypothetical protein